MLIGGCASHRLIGNASTHLSPLGPSGINHPANRLSEESTEFGTATHKKKNSDAKFSLSNMSYEESYPLKQPLVVGEPSQFVASDPRKQARSHYPGIPDMGRPSGVIRIDTRRCSDNATDSDIRKTARITNAVANPNIVINSDGHTASSSNKSRNQLKSSTLLPDSPICSPTCTMPLPLPPLKFTQLQPTSEGITMTKGNSGDVVRRQSSSAFQANGPKCRSPPSTIGKPLGGYSTNTGSSLLATLPYNQSHLAQVESKATAVSEKEVPVTPRQFLPARKHATSGPCTTDNNHSDNRVIHTDLYPEFEHAENLSKTPLSHGKPGFLVKYKHKKLCFVVLLLLFLLVLSVALMVYFAADKSFDSKNNRITLPNSDMSTSQPLSRSVTAKTVNPVKTPCLAEDCIKVTADLLNNMNWTADPCEDFYEYACGGWIRNNYIPPDKMDYGIRSQIAETNRRIIYQALIRSDESREISQDLRGNYDNLTSAERKAKIFFKSCLNTYRINNLGAQPLRDLINETGGWYALGNWDETRWDFNSMLYMLHGEQNVFAIFRTGVINDESGSNVFALAAGGVTFPDYRLYLSDGVEMKLKYLRLIKTVLKLLQASYINVTAEDIYNVEKGIAEVDFNSTATSTNHGVLTIKHLKTICPQINWLRLIKKMTRRKTDEHSSVYVGNIKYLRLLSRFLSTTNKRALHNFLTWRLVIERIKLLSWDFQEAQREFNSYLLAGKPRQSLWQRCMGEVDKYLQWAAAALFVRQTFDANKAAQVTEMVKNIQTAFRENLESVKWMDEETKIVAKDKLDAMTFEIAYPEYLLSDPSFLENKYDFELDESEYFKNMIKLIKGDLRQNLDEAFGPQSIDRRRWKSSPHSMDALYYPDRNQMAFSAGVLQPPFFSTNYPSALNYGCLGSMIGHELSHSVDDKGQRMDKNGVLNPWWSQATGDGFVKRAKCVEQAYSKYHIGSNFVRGDQTLTENIGDMAGLKLSYLAYKKFIRKNPQAAKNLPSSFLTDDKQFFIGYAQTWCNKRLPESQIHIINVDIHAPEKFRVMGVMSHNKEFAKAFKCPLGSPMNPKKKCSVW